MRHVEAPSEVAGRYVIAGRIGSGGMGDVFRARDSVLGRTVAIKMLPFDLAIQPGFVERFKAEAQAVARISHPNVVQVHDWGQEGDTYYMVMEYVRGKNLRQILSNNSKLHPRHAAQLTGQVLGALAAAHEEGRYPPGREAGERRRLHRRPGQGCGLRDRPGGRERGPDRRDARHRCLRGARAGPGRTGRPPHRSLLGRLHVVRAC